MFGVTGTILSSKLILFSAIRKLRLDWNLVFVGTLAPFSVKREKSFKSIIFTDVSPLRFL